VCLEALAKPAALGGARPLGHLKRGAKQKCTLEKVDEENRGGDRHAGPEDREELNAHNG
jgi:hypothetical protein